MKKNFFYRLFLISASILVSFIAIIVILGFFIISKTPIPEKRVNYLALITANKKLQNALVHISKTEQNNTPKKIH